MRHKGIWLFMILFLVAFAFKGMYGAYINVYLREELKFSYSQISIIGFASSITSMILAPVMGMLVSKYRHDKWFIIGSYVLLMIVNFMFASGPAFALALVLSLLYEGFNESSQPVLDSYTIIYLEQHNGNYGSIRGIGSFGYMLGTLLAGVIISFTGAMNTIFYGIVVVIACSILLILKLPHVTIKQHSKVTLSKDIPALIKNKKYMFIIIFAILVISSSYATGSFTTMHMIGAFDVPQSMIGLLTIVMVLPEVFLLQFSGRIEKKIGFKSIFLLGSLAFGIRWLGYALAPNVYVFLGLSILHAAGIAFALIPCFSYIRKTCSPSIFASAMALFTSATFLFNAIFKLFFGFIADATSTHMIFFIGAVLTFIGIGYLLIFIKE